MDGRLAHVSKYLTSAGHARPTRRRTRTTGQKELRYETEMNHYYSERLQDIAQDMERN